jgi:hypothetical protein
MQDLASELQPVSIPLTGAACRELSTPRWGFDPSDPSVRLMLIEQTDGRLAARDRSLRDRGTRGEQRPLEARSERPGIRHSRRGNRPDATRIKSTLASS